MTIKEELIRLLTLLVQDRNLPWRERVAYIRELRELAD